MTLGWTVPKSEKVKAKGKKISVMAKKQPPAAVGWGVALSRKC